MGRSEWGKICNVNYGYDILGQFRTGYGKLGYDKP
jgi:hypothetical protein